MNAGAARAARADRRLSGLPSDIPRDFKRAWADMTHRERGKLRRVFRAAQSVRRALGLDKHANNLVVASATVAAKDIQL